MCAARWAASPLRCPPSSPAPCPARASLCLPLARELLLGLVWGPTNHPRNGGSLWRGERNARGEAAARPLGSEVPVSEVLAVAVTTLLPTAACSHTPVGPAGCPVAFVLLFCPRAHGERFSKAVREGTVSSVDLSSRSSHVLN